MGKLTLLSFLRDQFTTLPTVDSFKCDLTGKTVIVVGSNTGLGLEAARHLATMNPGRLILACRSVSKGEMALESIRVTTKYKGGEVWVVDLTDFASISAFADKFEKDGGGRLDVLLENSAIVTETYYRTKDGLESTIQTNNLGTALLGILLLPFLSRSSADSVTPRIVIVASEVHYWAKLDTEVTSSPQMLEKLNSEEYCTASVMKQRYFISKLINVLFMRAFAARLSPQNPVIIDAVNPGFCRSELLRSVQPTFLMSMMERLLARSTECGSRTLVHAAIGGGKELRGRYLSSCAVREESDYCLSKEGVLSRIAFGTRLSKCSVQWTRGLTPSLRNICNPPPLLARSEAVFDRTLPPLGVKTVTIVVKPSAITSIRFSSAYSRINAARNCVGYSTTHFVHIFKLRASELTFKSMGKIPMFGAIRSMHTLTSSDPERLKSPGFDEDDDRLACLTVIRNDDARLGLLPVVPRIALAVEGI